MDNLPGYLKVYVITDRKLLPEGKFLDGVESALKGGVRAIQLREKDLSPAETLNLAREVRRLTKKYQARLFVNDRVDIALMAEADGVHLTESSVSVEEVKSRFPQLLVGVSTHSLESAKRAEVGGADFVTFSPIFDTPSKRGYGTPQGLDLLKEVTEEVQIPVLALGGIKRQNVASVQEAGAYGIALISGIWKAR
ncbi:MAG: thiamine phosphate synthase, partial [Nitrospina sp.]|nr:thiamine phosphate synthase [Nitrospina sp.]